MDPATRTWWIVVVFIAGACVALLAHSTAVATALLVVGFVAAAMGRAMIIRRDRRRR